MNKMKRIISSLLSASVIMASISFSTVAQAADSWETRTNDVDLRVAVIADTHVTASSNGAAFRNVVEALKTVCGDQLDAVAMNGDIVLQSSKTANYTAHYDTVYSILNAYGIGQQDEGLENNVPVIYAMGNHEFPQNNNDRTTCDESIAIFNEKTGQQLNHHAEYNGYHFIASGGTTYNLCDNTSNVSGTLNTNEEWIMAEVDKALADDATKPVFLMLHHPINGTAGNYSDKRYTSEFINFLAERPRVIQLTAHMHLAAQLPKTRWQSGYTAYQVPAGDGSGLKQASFIEISGSEVKIYKIDITKKEYIGDPWVIDTSKGAEGFLYTAAARENTNEPTYSDTAELKVSDITKYVATLTYPHGKCEQTGVQQDGYVQSHRIVLKNKESGIVVKEQTVATPYKTFTDYSAVDEATEYTLEYTGLSAGETYVVEVYARSPFGVESEPLTTEFTTEGQALKITTGDPITLKYDSTLLGDTIYLEEPIPGEEEKDTESHDGVKNYFVNLTKNAISLRGVSTTSKVDNYFTYKINVGEGYQITEPGYYQVSVRYVATAQYGILMSINDVPMIKATLPKNKTGSTLGESESNTVEDLGYIWLDKGENILKYEIAPLSGGGSNSLFTDLPVLRKVDKAIVDRVINNSYTIVDATETDASSQTKVYAGFRQGDYVIMPVKVPYTAAYRIEMSASSAQNYGFSAVYGEDEATVAASTDYTIVGEVQPATGSEKANFEKSSLTDCIILEADKQYYFKFCATTVKNSGIMTLEKIRIVDNGDYDANANLTSLSVDGYSLDADFDEDTLSYVVYAPSVPANNQITINAESFSANAKVTNTGVVEVTDTVTDIPVTVTSADGENTRVYNIRFVVNEPVSLNKTASIYYKDAEGVENTGDVSGVLTTAGVSDGTVRIPWNNYTTQGYIKVDLEKPYNLSGFTWKKTASGQLVNVEIYASNEDNFDSAVMLGKTTKDTYLTLGTNSYLDACSLDSTNAYQYVWIKINEEKDFCPTQISLYTMPEIDMDSTELTSLEVEGYSFDNAFDVIDTEYTIIADELPASGKVNIIAKAPLADIKITGLGEKAIQYGINELPVTVTSANGEQSEAYMIKFVVVDTHASLGCTATLYKGSAPDTPVNASKLFNGTGNVKDNGGNTWGVSYKVTAQYDIDLGAEYDLFCFTFEITNQGNVVKGIQVLGSNDPTFAEGTYEVLGTTDGTYAAGSKVATVPKHKISTTALSASDTYRYVRLIKPTGTARTFYPVKMDLYGTPTVTSVAEEKTETVTVPSNHYVVGDKVIAASYNSSGRLTAAQITDALNAASTKLVLTKENADDKVKVMVWKDLTDMTPRIAAVDLQ